MSIAKNIKYLRQLRGLTQQELAEQTSVARTYITHLELGSRIPNLIIAKEIATALNCSLDDLLDCKINQNKIN